MADTMIARVFDGIDEVCEWSALSETIENGPVRRGSLNELAEAAGNSAVILLLPATEVLLVELELPITSQRQLKKALPYALEDYLANDVENYHWAWCKQAGGKITVAAIEHERLAAHLQRFDTAGIKLQGVYAETLCLPVLDDSVSILLDGKRAVVRFTLSQGGGIDSDYLLPFVEKALPELNLAGRIQLWHTQPCADLHWPSHLSVTGETIASALSVLRPAKKNELNLLSGIYSPRESGNIRWTAWIPAATLMLVALLLQYGGALSAYRHSQEQLAGLEAANRQLFSQTFPQVKRIVNMKAQAEQALLALRKHQGDGGGAYLRLLYQSGEILSRDTALQLQALDFSGGVLSLHLTGASVAQIEDFKHNMEKNHNVKVDIQSAETGNNGLSAHVGISERAS